MVATVNSQVTDAVTQTNVKLVAEAPAEAPQEPISSECAYYNTGCWTDHHCHYLTVDDGCCRLVEVNAEAILPATPLTGHGYGGVVQLHFYLDDSFPHSIGKPISEWW